MGGVGGHFVSVWLSQAPLPEFEPKYVDVWLGYEDLFVFVLFVFVLLHICITTYLHHHNTDDTAGTYVGGGTRLRLFPGRAVSRNWDYTLLYTLQFPEIEKSNPEILLMTLPAIWASLRYKYKRKYKSISG